MEKQNYTIRKQLIEIEKHIKMNKTGHRKTNFSKERRDKCNHHQEMNKTGDGEI